MYPLKLRSVTSSFLLALVLVFASVAAHAVDVNARIKGTVTDPSGAVIAGASVTATNLATGVKYPTKTLSSGDYLFPQLPVGTYSITVTESGFKSFTATGIILTIDQEYVEPVKLEVGNAAETLEVAADAVQVNTTDMQLNNIVNATQMAELPLIGRGFTGLELVEPGVQASSDRFGTFSVSGAQTQQSEYLINGADTNDISLNTVAFSPNLDAIDQFNLIDGPLNAEYDRNSGGIVSATIKQGTNHIHGDAFEFYRDTFLNTLNYFQKSVATGHGVVSKYHQNIFGGTIGGPIFRDKLFFFFGYQGTRQIVPQSGGNVTVYSPADLSGDFSEDLAAAGSNPKGSTIALTSHPIPAGITIPTGCTAGEAWNACLTPTVIKNLSSSFNSITSALVKTYVPPANNGTYGYIFHPVTTTTIDQYLGRGDWALNSNNQFTFLYIQHKSTAADTLPFTGATLPGFGDQSVLAVKQGTFDYVHQFNSTLVNDFAAHYTRFNYAAVIPQKAVLPSSAGFQITPQNTAGAGLPALSVSGFFELGFSTNGPQPRIDQVVQFDDNITKTFGHHSLKFGYDGRRFNVSNPFSAVNNGSYSFSRSSTSIYSTGDPSLDFLLGIPASFSQGSGAVIQASAFLNYIYAQDTWRIGNTVTLSYGLGYSIDTPLNNHQYNGEGIACLSPGVTSKVFTSAPTGIVYPGDPGCTGAAQSYIRYGEFGPRFGFAWAPNWGRFSGSPGKFAIRGGFGIYYDRTEEESALQTLETPPFGLSSSGVADANAAGHTYKPTVVNPYADINSSFSIGNKFPFVPPAAGSAPSYAQFLPIDISSYGPSFRAPYAENFQLSIEREFPARIVTRTSYVGSLARHNQADYEGDYTTAAGHAACLADPVCSGDGADQVVDYPTHTIANNSDIASVGTVGSLATSNYNALQISVTKAQTHGLTFQVSYTYAHAMDTGSSFENSGFGGSFRGYNQYQPSLNYGDSAYDVRHRLVIAPIYISPILHGSAWYTPENLALSGWEISGITTLSTGFPFDISYGGGNANSLWCSIDYSFYACPDIPEQVGTYVTSNPRVRSTTTGYTNWFKNSGFTDEPIGSFGNIHRDPYHGPGLNYTNLILAKNFNMSADGVRRLQIRMESDNVFNHVNFANPDGNFNDATFGQITGISSSVPARQTQLAAKFYF